MMFPEPKYVIFSDILLHLTFGTKISGLPYFYSVKLDVIGFGQKAHFWNRETSYIKVLGVLFHELDDVPLKVTQLNRALSPSRNNITPEAHFWSFHFAQAFCVHLHHHNCELGREEATATGGACHADNFARAKR